jgi:hypothetical protein
VSPGCCRNLPLSHLVTFNESHTPLFSYVLSRGTHLVLITAALGLQVP